MIINIVTGQDSNLRGALHKAKLTKLLGSLSSSTKEYPFFHFNADDFCKYDKYWNSCDVEIHAHSGDLFSE